MTNIERRGGVYGKRPATIVRQEPPTEVMRVGEYDFNRLVARVADLERQGEIRRARRRPSWNEGTREWHIPVHRLRRAPSPWRKRALMAAPVVAVLALVLYAVHTLAAYIGLAALMGILGLFTAAVVKAHVRPSVEVTTTVTTNVRVR